MCAYCVPGPASDGKGGTKSLDTFGDVNYLAVIVGALVYFGIGALWYSPALFATPWMAASGVQPGNQIPVGLFALSLAVIGVLVAVWR